MAAWCQHRTLRLAHSTPRAANVPRHRLSMMCRCLPWPQSAPGRPCKCMAVALCHGKLTLCAASKPSCPVAAPGRRGRTKPRSTRPMGTVISATRILRTGVMARTVTARPCVGGSRLPHAAAAMGSVSCQRASWPCRKVKHTACAIITAMVPACRPGSIVFELRLGCGMGMHSYGWAR